MNDLLKDMADKTLLVMDDDAPFRNRLIRALETRGFIVTGAAGIAEAKAVIDASPPAFAVMDMRLEDGNGLKAVEYLHEKRPDARAIMLTGYGNIATAVAAVKSGAIDYLSKPATADDVVKALLSLEGDTDTLPENPMSADRVRYEHMQRIFAQCENNVSETARRLNMHRRTLQRILAKKAPQ